MDARTEYPPGTSDYTVASDHYHHVREDVALFAELGLKAYRFSAAANFTAIRNWLYLDMAVHGRYNTLARAYLVKRGWEPTIEDGAVHDPYRIEYLAQHVEQMQWAVTDGVEVLGYCPWSAIDLVSTHQGVGKRYGFIYVDREEDDLKDGSPPFETGPECWVQPSS